MERKSETAFVGAIGFDTIATINVNSAKALSAWGMKFGVRYLGSLNSKEVDTIIGAGMAVMPVTYGLKKSTLPNGEFGKSYGARSVKQTVDAGITVGTTVWLDLEECNGTVQTITEFVNNWAYEIKSANFVPGLYVGAGAVLSSDELYKLGVIRYWQSLSKEIDSRGALAEPNCGWSMIQLYPSVTASGVWVDIDVIQKDYKNRLPTWCTAAVA